MFCIECGSKLESNWQFCTVCGKELINKTTNSEPSLEKLRWPTEDENLTHKEAEQYKNFSSKPNLDTISNLKSRDKLILFCVSVLIVVLIGFVLTSRDNQIVNTPLSATQNTETTIEGDTDPNQQTPAVSNTPCKSWAVPIWSTNGDEVLKCEGDIWVVKADLSLDFLSQDLLERLNNAGGVKWTEDPFQPISVPDFDKRAYRTFISQDDCLVTELVYEGSLDELWDNWGKPILIWEFKDYKSGLFIHLHVPDRPNALNSACMKSASDTFQLNFTNN